MELSWSNDVNKNGSWFPPEQYERLMKSYRTKLLELDQQDVESWRYFVLLTFLYGLFVMFSIIYHK